MNDLTRKIIQTIYLSEVAADFEATLLKMTEAQDAADEAWFIDDESAQWKQAAKLVEQLNDQAQVSCTELLQTFKASGINAESACGENGDFFVYLVTAGARYVIAS